MVELKKRKFTNNHEEWEAPGDSGNAKILQKYGMGTNSVIRAIAYISF